MKLKMTARKILTKVRTCEMLHHVGLHGSNKWKATSRRHEFLISI